MKKVVIEEKYLNRVQISKNEISNYEEIKNLPNARIYREGTNDEYVVFNTIDLSKAINYKVSSKPKPKKIKTAYKITQFASSGQYCCDFGTFESEEVAIEEMFKGLSKLYKGFKKEVWFDENSKEWHCEKYDFIIKILPVEFNTFGEV